MKTKMIDEVLDVLARVDAGLSASLEDALGIQKAGPALSALLTAGAAYYRNTTADRDRIRLKALQLNPDLFRQVRLQQQQVRTPNPSYEKAKAARQAEREARSEAVYANFRRSMRELDDALSLYEKWKLASGKPLGDATREDLLAEAHLNRAASEGHMRNVGFYEQLAAKVPAGATVRQAVDLEVAHRLRETAYLAAPEGGAVPGVAA